MKTWRVDLTEGGRSIAETKIQRGIFQGDALSPLLFIIAMMPLNHILSKCAPVYTLSRSQGKIKNLMYMDNIKLLAQKEYKAGHDWVGKVVHWEMCRKFQFDHTNKWYMHNPAPVLENASNKLQWDFNIQTDHLIPARRPDLIIVNKKKRESE